MFILFLCEIESIFGFTMEESSQTIILSKNEQKVLSLIIIIDDYMMII